MLSSTRRGARLARLLAVAELRSWGVSRDLVERAELVVAELAANAVLHGRVPGRCFRLTLALDPAAGLRVEVSDARGDLRPTDTTPDPLSTGGRGLTSSRPSPTTGTASLSAHRQDGPGGSGRRGCLITSTAYPQPTILLGQYR
ncbi:ATP-binding protein [Streptomyces thermocarboxydus]